MDPLAEICSRLERIEHLLSAQTATAPLRNTYSCEEFAKEVLDGKRSVEWVQDECRGRRIQTVGRRPWMIPMGEAVRYISGKKR